MEDNLEDAVKGKSKIKTIEIVFLLGLIIAVFLFRLQFLDMPLDRDEGAYAYIAERMYHGETPYKETFDHKPPFIYYIYKTAFDVFGTSADSVRHFTTGYVIFVMVLIFVFVRTFCGVWAGLVAPLLYALFQHNLLFQGAGANTEIFTQLPLLLGLLFLLIRNEKYEKANLFASGFFIGVALYIKTMIVLVVFVPVLYIFFYCGKEKWKMLLWYIFGFITMNMVVLLWALKNGVVNSFIESNILYNIFYIGAKESTAFYTVLFKGLTIFIKSNIMFVFAFLYSLYLLIRKPKERINFVLFFVVIMLLVGIAILKGMYPHYYMVLTPYTAILSALMLKDFGEFLARRKGGTFAVVVVVLMLVIGGIAFVKGSKLDKILSRRDYAMSIFYEADAIGKYLAGKKTHDTKLFVWPNEPEIYFISGIKSQSRYIYSYPYEYFKGALETTIEQVKTNSPDYFVMQKGAEAQLLEGFVKKEYVVIKELNNLVLYQKK